MTTQTLTVRHAIPDPHDDYAWRDITFQRADNGAVTIQIDSQQGSGQPVTMPAADVRAALDFLTGPQAAPARDDPAPQNEGQWAGPRVAVAALRAQLEQTEKALGEIRGLQALHDDQVAALAEPEVLAWHCWYDTGQSMAAWWDSVNGEDEERVYGRCYRDRALAQARADELNAMPNQSRGDKPTTGRWRVAQTTFPPHWHLPPEGVAPTGGALTPIPWQGTLYRLHHPLEVAELANRVADATSMRRSVLADRVARWYEEGGLAAVRWRLRGLIDGHAAAEGYLR